MEFKKGQITTHEEVQEKGFEPCSWKEECIYSDISGNVLIYERLDDTRLKIVYISSLQY